jgi:hypothetical protein
VEEQDGRHVLDSIDNKLVFGVGHLKVVLEMLVDVAHVRGTTFHGSDHGPHRGDGFKSFRQGLSGQMFRGRRVVGCRSDRRGFLNETDDESSDEGFEGS